MADLTTTANVKTWLGLTSVADDALIARLVTSASDFIQAWLNRTFAGTSYTDTFDGKNFTKYSAYAYPITAVASVTVDGQNIPASTGPTVAGYVFSKTMIGLIGYSFTPGMQNCSITYTAGFASIPTEIEQACIELVGLRYRNKDRIGLNSKGANGESISFAQIDLSGSVTDTLQQYKKVHMS